MPRPDRIQYENAFYHVMNRGRGRQNIFHGADYYEDFLMTLAESHARFDAVVHAYCLMGNHYHLLIETPRANLDRIMRHINGVYTQRYNRRKRTDGPLFRGRYKAILVDEDAYFLGVGRYIHRNPAEVKGAGEDALAKHRWSSYLAYINTVPAPDWLARERAYQMMGRRDRYRSYREFIFEGNDTEIDKFYSKGNMASIIGDKLFKQSILEERENLQVSGSLSRALSDRPDIPVVVEAVATVFAVDADTLTRKQVGRQRSNLARKIAMYCCQRMGDHSLKQIATYFSLSHEGSVSSAIGVINTSLAEGELVSEINELEKLLGIMK